MAKLINLTGELFARHVTYGQNYGLNNEGIIVIGSRDSDILFQGTNGRVSRQHAFIIGKEGKFYVGDLSSNGTYCPVLKGHEFSECTRLVNALDTKSFKENYGNFDLEKEYYKGADCYTDEEGIKRGIFLNSFIKDCKNVESLIAEGDRVMYPLKHGVKISIHPFFILEFRENVFKRLFGK